MTTALPETVRRPRLIMTKIVARYFLLLLLLLMLNLATSFMSQVIPLMQYVSAIFTLLLMIFGGGYVSEIVILLLMILGSGFTMLNLWFLAAIVFQPVFPILFLIFRSSWLQFMGMIYHLAMAGYMIAVAYACFYYYNHFDEIEKNDNPGILAIIAVFQGDASISNAVIFIIFTVMLYFDYRKQKKYRLLSGKLK